MALELTDNILSTLKALSKDDKDEKKHPHYKHAVNHAEEMAWHVYGTKPEKLLERNRPNEDPAIKHYRLESYEPITKSVCKKAVSILYKVFNPSLYSIKFGDSREAQILKKYTEEDYPRFNSIVNYYGNFVLKKMIADPNGVLIVQPFRYGIPVNERIEPIVTCYNSKDIHRISEFEAYLFDGKEENGSSKIWHYTYLDINGIYKLDFVKQNQNYSVVVVAEYVHNLGMLPLWQLGGEYSQEQEGLLESYFFDAVPFWNEAINDHSDVQGNYRLHINAQKWEITEECEFVEEGKYACTGGYIFNQEQGKKYKCPSCKGSGSNTAKSPYDVYTVNKDKVFPGDGATALTVPPFGYVAPPVEGIRMLEEKAERNLEKGLHALNMDVVNKIGENQSGVSKSIDRTELNSFLQKIADQFFEVHLPNTYYFFAHYMFGVELKNPEKIREIEPSIIKPTQFDVYSTFDLTAQFSEAKTAKLNSSYLRVKQIEINNREFHNYPEVMARLNLELKLDPLAEVTRDEVSLMLGNMTITKETAIIHDNISAFVSRAVIEYPKFSEMELKAQQEILMKYAKEVIESNKVTLPMDFNENEEENSEEEKEEDNE